MAAKVPDIPKPSLGIRRNQEEGVTVDPDKMSEGVLGILEAHKRAIDTESAMKILDKTTGQEQKTGSETGEMVKAMAEVLKGSAETNKASTSMLIEGIAGVINLKGSGNGSGQEMWQQLTMLLLTSLLDRKETPTKAIGDDRVIEVLKENSQMMREMFKGQMDLMQRQHEKEVEDLKQRSGASPLDQQIHGQLLPYLVTKAMENITNPPDPKSQIKQLAEWKQVLRSLDGERGDSGALSPEKLQAMGMQMEFESKKLEIQDRKDEREMRKQPPAWLPAVTEALQGLSGKNFIPTSFATQADDAAAAAMMGE